MTDSFDNYYTKFSIFNPAYIVARTAGRQIRDKATKYLSGRLIDIGCGEKAKQILVGDIVDGYIGLDHLDSVHDLSTVDLIGTAYNIPIEDESFNSVLC